MASDPNQPGGRQPDLLGNEEDADIPPPPLGAATDPLDEDTQERLHRMSRRGRLLPTILVIAALGAFVAIVWWAYTTANRSETPGEIPVVEALPGEEKVPPESEGGMEVPNQDKLIYEQLGSNEGQPEVERLLPPPEEPLQPPAPPPAPEPAGDTAGLTPPPPPQEMTLEEMMGGVAEDAAEAAADAETSPADAGAGAVATDAEPTPSVETAPEPAAEPAAEPASEPAAEEAPAPEPAPQVAAGGGGFRIQLAAVKSEADAKAEWTRLQKAHADLLGGLAPTIQRADLGDQGIFYRIQGGPLTSGEAAQALCDKLKAKDQACLVVKP